MTIRCRLVFVAVVLIKGSAAAQPVTQGPPNLSTLLMQSTFKIADSHSNATAFIVGRPAPTATDAKRAFYVLVTAAHVLNGFTGDTAVLQMRQQDGTWNKLPVLLQIRDNCTPRWVEHPTADVAAMYVELPPQLSSACLLRARTYWQMMTSFKNTTFIRVMKCLSSAIRSGSREITPGFLFSEVAGWHPIRFCLLVRPNAFYSLIIVCPEWHYRGDRSA